MQQLKSSGPNRAGTLQLYLLAFDDVDRTPDEVGALVEMPVYPIGDAEWYQWKLDLYKLSFKESTSSTANGPRYNWTVEAQFSGDDEVVRPIIYQWQRKKALCLVKDANGKWRLVGRKNRFHEWISLELEYTTGQGPNGSNSYKITWSGSGQQPAPFYIGHNPGEPLPHPNALLSESGFPILRESGEALLREY
ncbi:MAG: hypothetical protein AAFQ98_24025 [Bacteroidota bacterium]